MALQIQSLDDSVDIFKVKECKLNVELVNDQLHQQQSSWFLPCGSIDDLGPTHAKLRVYVFKFDNTQPCSEVIKTDVNVYEEQPDCTEISFVVKRNVVWSFYSLNDDTTDVGKYFDESGQLKQPFFTLSPLRRKNGWILF